MKKIRNPYSVKSQELVSSLSEKRWVFIYRISTVFMCFLVFLSTNSIKTSSLNIFISIHPWHSALSPNSKKSAYRYSNIIVTVVFFNTLHPLQMLWTQKCQVQIRREFNEIGWKQEQGKKIGDWRLVARYRDTKWAKEHSWNQSFLGILLQ